MPKSRLRKKRSSGPAPLPKSSQKAVKIGPNPYVAPLMLALFVIGLLWIVVFYMTRGDLPLMDSIGNWNLVIGFGFIAAGFVVSTRWR